jgi:hypothetical protein
MMVPHQLTFDEEPHIYRLGNVVIPSVTQVLGGIFKPYFPPGPHRVKGRRVHKATELADLNTIHRYEVAEYLMGYVAAWRAVCREFGWIWEPECIECRVFDPVRLVAGTIDRVRVDSPLVVDIKSGAASKEAALQTAAYAEMRFPDCYARVERCAVEIHDNGTFNPPIWHRDPHDFVAWHGAVDLWKWMNRKR